MFIKEIPNKLEIEIQNVVASLGLAPRIHWIDGNIVHMDEVKGHCLADLYTDDPQNVPDWIWDEIHRILTVLFEVEGIEYVDITSYNFMLETDTQKVWIIDFGHAYYTSLSDDNRPLNWFLREILNDGGKCWNPDFA
jgi:RIO-like serine/threonine protein kinase